MTTEQRFFKVNVRRVGALGVYRPEIFELTVPITGSYHDLCAAAIATINEQGFEVFHIISHSKQRDCL